jgi:hypothetical protein
MNIVVGFFFHMIFFFFFPSVLSIIEC